MVRASTTIMPGDSDHRSFFLQNVFDAETMAIIIFSIFFVFPRVFFLDFDFLGGMHTNTLRSYGEKILRIWHELATLLRSFFFKLFDLMCKKSTNSAAIM